MIGRILRAISEFRLGRRIAGLTSGQREALLAASIHEAVPFQGEGVHVFLRDERIPRREAYVCSLGEIGPRDAEDWLIADLLRREPAHPALADAVLK